ncbi:MAG: hypothetical protein COW03_06630 [Cytophagales bacterium CG12_big_fil_rev_8_21_14_0_65_40_12]|nr:MAG: hypothetical protein COW03_06630 [Cytophagales bacterium CG12_big_fil_rev_8_21_14_0_65_40_12]PIW03318.1 MAG: hypothetical protein COW40_15785 [Cytophagales bacterium CG17_big_fil_post_rev_8_21_14_2_50_40_13]
MKRLRLRILIGVLLLASVVLPIQAERANKRPAMTHTDSLRSIAIAERLIEIKELDKSNLKASEKKALRKEVREIKKEDRANGGGLYLSVGSIIIIILLLILLL